MTSGASRGIVTVAGVEVKGGGVGREGARRV